MNSVAGRTNPLLRRLPGPIAIASTCCFSTSLRFRQADSTRGPPQPLPQDKADAATSFLGTQKRLREYNLTDKVVLVSGAARGLGLTQAEALLEVGATGAIEIVYALDRLPEPSADFPKIQERAEKELGTSLHYRQIDVRDTASLLRTVADIAVQHGRLDGLIAAAGIQQETPALEYTAKDADRVFKVNITGAFITAQAAAKQMGLICSAYNASKAAVIQLARNLTSE
ncbi:hypothetical protein B0A49_10725 [Cryomyces minteri]|uniref:Uncharacterized protein n=1 Tax=Cryomyces minteri TaxID=331657 RepID=A0A4U0W5J5_9PEZI|nr:hypothetical protein B0A49_10725 [Cryomyces minteri]